LRKKETRLILATVMLLAVLLLVASCQGGEAVDVVLPDPSAGKVNTCLSCHSNQDKVMALAVEPEAVEAASSGEG
jgi:hypothetical protein